MKQGTKLTNKDGDVITIQGNIGDTWFYVNENECSYSATIKQLKEYGYTIPKEKWVPEEHEYYYCIDSSMHILHTNNSLMNVDEERIEAGNCFKQESEAEQMRDKLQEVLNKGL